MASLLILKGANQGTRLQLDQDVTVLGRNPDCHVVISGTAVSRAHAHILRLKGKYFIEDQASRNKTFVNNQEIPPRTQVPLKDNDRIKICDFLCTYHDGPALKPLPPEMRREEPEPVEDGQGSTTVEAALSNVGSHVLLESQPAEKLKTLLEISTNLSLARDLDSLWPKIVENLFQLFKYADRCFIILKEEGSSRLIPRVIKTRRLQDESSAQFSRKIVNQCLENVQALLSDDASHDSRFAMSQSIADFRIRSVMCAPLWYQDGKAFGVIQLDTQDRTKKFTEDDLKFLMGVASQASVALENAKLHEDQLVQERYRRDLDIAREVQRGFLPTEAPDVPGYEFFTHYEAAQEVGGDYYDFIPLPQKRWVIMLGDVAGKGVPAALLMAKISSDARTCMLTESGPAAAITRLNTLLYQNTHTDRFVTLIALQLDPSEHAVTVVNAGHPAPLVYRRSTGACEEVDSHEFTGLPIGIREDEQYQSFLIRLDAGDSVLLFTDGISEAMDVHNKQLQVEGIRNSLEGAPPSVTALGGRLVHMVKHHAAGRGQHDDITLVCFGRKIGAPVDALPAGET
jgi:serine phosphatase RsbU (regulator of sigma subunit)